MKTDEKSKNNLVIKDNKFYIFQCPHCEYFVEVHHDQLNCHIFRHAFLKHRAIKKNGIY